MKTVVPAILLLIGSHATADSWLDGNWDGFCQMSVLENDGSIIWNYEFGGKTGTLEVREFSDNRCQILKKKTLRTFKLKATPRDEKIVQVDIEFTKSAAGQLALATYAFERYGPNRMGLNSIYMLKQMEKSGKVETLTDNKDGSAGFSTQNYTRSSR